jgi:hypothetical protein
MNPERGMVLPPPQKKPGPDNGVGSMCTFYEQKSPLRILENGFFINMS